MAGFDPDAYLAEKSASAFDPDKYLSEKSGGMTAKEKEEKVQEQKQMGTAALEHAGNAISLGYLPAWQAAAEPLTTKLGDLITGQNISKDLPSQVQRRDENIARQE